MFFVSSQFQMFFFISFVCFLLVFWIGSYFFDFVKVKNAE